MSNSTKATTAARPMIAASCAAPPPDAAEELHYERLTRFVSDAPGQWHYEWIDEERRATQPPPVTGEVVADKLREHKIPQVCEILGLGRDTVLAIGLGVGQLHAGTMMVAHLRLPELHRLDVAADYRARKANEAGAAQ